jgi:hypothetical protein
MKLQTQSIHRQIMKEELNTSVCSICNYTFVKMCVHHIDGDRINNKKENLVVVCDKCHHRIHKGLRFKDRKLPNEVKNELWIYRTTWLKNKFDMPIDMVEKKVQYEKWKLSNFSFKIIIKNRCYMCLSNKNLYMVYPEYIKHLNFISKEEKKDMWIPFCKECYKKFKKSL